MKKLLLFLLVLPFISCSNPDTEKLIKRVEALENRVDSLEYISDIHESDILLLDSLQMELQKPEEGSLLWELEQEENK